MFKFTSLFINNFPGFINPSVTLIPSSVSTVGADLIRFGANKKVGSLLGGTATAVGSFFIYNACDLYLDSILQLNDTQAYIESLDIDGLEELIEKLESKQFSIEDIKNEIITNKKQLDNKKTF